jgi:hypothetical protein
MGKKEERKAIIFHYRFSSWCHYSWHIQIGSTLFGYFVNTIEEQQKKNDHKQNNR